MCERAHTRYENMWYRTAPKGGLPIRARDVDQEVLSEDDLPIIIEAPRRGDSVKPDEAYEALERLYGDVRRFELYARRLQPGWTVWGNRGRCLNFFCRGLSWLTGRRFDDFFTIF